MPFNEASEWFLDPINHFQEVLELIVGTRFCYCKYVVKFFFSNLCSSSIAFSWIVRSLWSFSDRRALFCFAHCFFFSIELRSSLTHLRLTKNREGSIRSSFVTVNFVLSFRTTVHVVSSSLIAIPPTDSEAVESL